MRSAVTNVTRLPLNRSRRRAALFATSALISPILVAPVHAQTVLEPAGCGPTTFQNGQAYITTNCTTGPGDNSEANGPFSASVTGGAGSNGSDSSFFHQAGNGNPGATPGAMAVTNGKLTQVDEGHEVDAGGGPFGQGIWVPDLVTKFLGGVLVGNYNNGYGVYLSSSGGNGGDGGASDLIHDGGSGGSGGDGGVISFTNSAGASITTTGYRSAAVVAESFGGNGGNGYSGDDAAKPGNGGNGGNGGDITLTNAGTLTTSGRYAAGFMTHSAGGDAGAGGSSGWFGNGGSGGVGGNAGANVTASNSGTIATSGDGSVGAVLQSVGGGGGVGADSTGRFIVLGGSGGIGGNAETIQFNNTGTITTQGQAAHGASLMSIGGGGGHGGSAFNASVFVGAAIGGIGGGGGDAGSVTGTNSGTITTAGSHAMGLQAKSIGGGGGDGGNAGGVSVGLIASAELTLGGSGGSGGTGADITLTNASAGTIRTGYVANAQPTDALNAPLSGDYATGILAHSIGGGGGSGGRALSISAAGGPGALDINVALGGSGGSGGNGGNVSVESDGTVSTAGRHADAILAQSIGGGGGVGGNAIDVGLAVGEIGGSIGVGVGGSGGSGGHAGSASVTANGYISTNSTFSRGVVAQSIGGGGGHGGSVVDVSTQMSNNGAALNVGIGGTGGEGGTGGAATVSTTGNSEIVTRGHKAHGIVAHSVGGGGGSGGNINSYAISATAGNGTAVSSSVGVGGKGGSGDTGGTASVTHAGSVTTYGDHAYGALVQSVGGGGGDGGNVLAMSLSASVDTPGTLQYEGGRNISADAAVGGNGGTGGHGGAASFTSTNGASIATVGEHSAGVVVQSVGGGGGVGGIAHSFAVSTAVPTNPSRFQDLLTRWQNLAIKLFGEGPGDPEQTNRRAGIATSIAIGGTGGAAGDGGAASVTLAAGSRIMTSGGHAQGVHVQSVGGGGGKGGLSHSDGVAGVDAYSLNFSLGGAGGSSGNGGAITVTGQASNRTLATIQTTGAHSHGILAHSVGGGGGLGGASMSGDTSVPTLANQAISISLGGTGGSSGDGGSVSVNDPANIRTTGALSAAIFAQSVGGGGGAGGTATGAGTLNYVMGLNGGGAGKGGDVTVTTATAALETHGHASPGIHAQSVGGGGGAGGVANPNPGWTSYIPKPTLGIFIGGAGAAGNYGGNVTVNPGGTITTTGNVSPGILAQSVGGGGGTIQADALTIVDGAIPLQIGATASAGWGGRVTVADSQAEKGSITTSGKGSHGIIAQSLSGGGASLLIATELDQSQINHTFSGTTQTSSEIAPVVDVTLYGTVNTSGDNAYGILAQNFAYTSTIMGLEGVTNYHGQTGQNGSTVSVDVEGTVTTTGSNAHGIVLQMNASGGSAFVPVGGTVSVSGQGSWGVNITNGDGAGTGQMDTTLLIPEYGLISAGEKSAGGIRVIDQNGTYQLDVAGTLDAASSTAFTANNSGAITIHSTGIVIGDVLSTAVAGSATSFSNAGTMTGSVKGFGTYTGIGSGTHYLRFDPAGRDSDSITVASFKPAGPNTIIPVLKSLPFGGVTPSTIFSTVGGDNSWGELDPTTQLQMGLSNGSAATLYEYRQGNFGSISIANATIDFTRAGLSGNDGALAVMANTQLQTTITQNSVAKPSDPLETVLLNAANAATPQLLATQLESLNSAKHFPGPGSSAAASGTQHSSLLSCGDATSQFVQLAQDSCDWTKLNYSVLDDRDTGLSERARGMAFGRQTELHDHVFLGLSAGYDATSFYGNSSSGDGHRISLGAIAKYSDGPLYGSLSIVGSYDWSDNTRSIRTGKDILTAQSDQDKAAVSTRFRGAYLFEAGAFDIIPMIDFDLTMIRDFGFRETGAGSLNLRVESATHLLFDVRPALRIGMDTRLEDMTLSGYAEAGTRIALTDTSHRLSMPDAPAGDFGVSLTNHRDDVIGTFAAGITAAWDNGVEARFQYEAGVGESTRSHQASAKLAIKF